MRVSVIFYRLRQFCQAISARLSDEEYAWLRGILTPEALLLFSTQALPEQRHALDVAGDLYKQKQVIEETYGNEVFHNLILAALFHDCGKSRVRLKLWQRIFIVLGVRLPSTLAIHNLHPVWGKQLAARAGLNDDIQTLIENHHRPGNLLEKILSEADCRH